MQLAWHGYLKISAGYPVAFAIIIRIETRET